MLFWRLLLPRGKSLKPQKRTGCSDFVVKPCWSASLQEVSLKG
jgi:hypothetical protein